MHCTYSKETLGHDHLANSLAIVVVSATAASSGQVCAVATGIDIDARAVAVSVPFLPMSSFSDLAASALDHTRSVRREYRWQRETDSAYICVSALSVGTVDTS